MPKILIKDLKLFIIPSCLFLLALFANTDKDFNRDNRSNLLLQNKFKQSIVSVHFGQEINVSEFSYYSKTLNKYLIKKLTIFSIFLSMERV